MSGDICVSKGLNRLCVLISTIFYIGYLPVAPGSIGSFAALFLYWFIKDSHQLVNLAILLSLVMGLLTAGRAESFLGGKDAGEIIIDEFAGMLISLYLLPARMGYVVAAFLLFRFFDIVKPAPIAKLEKIKGGLGVMADDVMAGVYANLVMQVVYRIF